MVAALRDSNHGDLKEIGRWTWENWSREPSNIMEINIEFSIKKIHGNPLSYMR